MPSRKEKERRDEEHPLRAKVRAIAEKGGARSVAVAYYDYETETAWSYRGDEWRVDDIYIRPAPKDDDTEKPTEPAVPSEF